MEGVFHEPITSDTWRLLSAPKSVRRASTSVRGRRFGAMHETRAHCGAGPRDDGPSHAGELTLPVTGGRSGSRVVATVRYATYFLDRQLEDVTCRTPFLPTMGTTHG